MKLCDIKEGLRIVGPLPQTLKYGIIIDVMDGKCEIDWYYTEDQFAYGVILNSSDIIYSYEIDRTYYRSITIENLLSNDF
jgi:hypothetical protein